MLYPDEDLIGIPLQTLFHIYGKPHEVEPSFTKHTILFPTASKLCRFYWKEITKTWYNENLKFDMTCIMDYDNYPNITDIIVDLPLYFYQIPPKKKGHRAIRKLPSKIEMTMLFKSHIMGVYGDGRSKKSIDKKTSDMQTKFSLACLGGIKNEKQFWCSMGK